MKLHEAIQTVLRNGPMTASEIADEINRKELYQCKDGSPVPSSQIHARIRQYSQYFDRCGNQYKNRE